MICATVHTYVYRLTSSSVYMCNHNRHTMLVSDEDLQVSVATSPFLDKERKRLFLKKGGGNMRYIFFNKKKI